MPSSTGGGVPASGSATTTAAGSSATLAPGYSFIRGVEDTYFHKYLQSAVLSTASDAVLGDPSSAAQFQITNGQLIQNANGTPLYAVVEMVGPEKLLAQGCIGRVSLGGWEFGGSSGRWRGTRGERGNTGGPEPQGSANRQSTMVDLG